MMKIFEPKPNKILKKKHEHIEEKYVFEPNIMKILKKQTMEPDEDSDRSWSTDLTPIWTTSAPIDGTNPRAGQLKANILDPPTTRKKAIIHAQTDVTTHL